MRIEAEMVKEQPNLAPLAMHLAEECVKFFMDPENEKAFREWKAEQDEKKRIR